MAVDRFGTPLYTVAEASHYLGVPNSTFRSWAKGYVRRSGNRAAVRGDPIVTVIPGQRIRSASVPFVGLAEGLVLAGIRRAGVLLQRIRPATEAQERARSRFGIEVAVYRRCRGPLRLRRVVGRFGG